MSLLEVILALFISLTTIALTTSRLQSTFAAIKRIRAHQHQLNSIETSLSLTRNNHKMQTNTKRFTLNYSPPIVTVPTTIECEEISNSINWSCKAFVISTNKRREIISPILIANQG